MPPTSPSPEAIPAPARQPAAVISIHSLRTHCSTCSLRELCLPMGFTPDELQQIDAAVTSRIRLKKGATLFHAGAPFSALYAVRIGTLKTTMAAEDGRAQVAGYHMSGDLIGLDGIATGRHGCETVALEDAEVCALPFDGLEALARKVPALQHNLHRFLGSEIARDHSLMLLLGNMRAEERLAAFLLNLAERFHARGYSATEYQLRMTREEIGSYLGLTLETVSRLFSRFQHEGLIQVQGRAVKLIDRDALRELAQRRPAK